MKNADEIRERLNEVKKMKSYTEAINVLADIQYQIGAEACSERHELRKEIGKLREDVIMLKCIILGDGKPEDSVLARMARVETCTNKIQNTLETIEENLKGGYDTEGLIEQLHTLKKMGDNIKKLTWIIVSIFIGEVILALIGIL